MSFTHDEIVAKSNGFLEDHEIVRRNGDSHLGDETLGIKIWWYSGFDQNHPDLMVDWISTDDLQLFGATGILREVESKRLVGREFVSRSKNGLGCFIQFHRAPFVPLFLEVVASTQKRDYDDEEG